MADDKTTETTADANAEEEAGVATLEKALAGRAAVADTEDAGAAAAAGQEVTPDSEPSADQPAGSAAQDKPSEVTDSQYNAAKHLGYTEAEIADMDSGLAERVERESQRLRQHGSELGQQEAVLKTRAQELETGKVSTVATALAGTDAGTASKSTDGDSFDALSKQLGEFTPLSPDDVLDEGVLRTKFNDLLDITQRVHGHSAAVRQDMTTTKNAVAGFQARQEHDAEQEMTGATQDFIKTVDHDIFPTYGRGDTSALPRGSPELAARTALTARAKALHELHGQAGEQVSMAQCHDEALMQLSPEQYKEAALKPVKEKTAKIAESAPARVSDTQKAVIGAETEEQQVAKLDKDLRAHNLPTK